MRDSAKGPIREPSEGQGKAITRTNTKVPEVIPEPPHVDLSTMWRMFVDGAKNNLGAGAGAGAGAGVGVGIGVQISKGAIFERCLRLNFFSMNNEAEYVAFIVGLRSANKLKIHDLHIFNNSKLIVN